MTMTRREHFKLLAGVASAALMPVAVFAEEATDGPVVHEVLMLNRNPADSNDRNVFIPKIVRAKLGDSVKFLATDRGHNAQSDPNMLPEGFAGFKGKNNEEIEVALNVEGTIGYYCQPHRGVGMVGLILVGDASSNFDAARGAKQRGKARAIYTDLFAEAEAMLAAEA